MAKLTKEHIEIFLQDIKFMDRKFHVMEKGDGFLIQMSYMEADVDNPDAGLQEQKTRKWYVSPHMCETELVETCWAMVCRSQMHVTAEHFTYRGRRVYSPHFDINARLAMCDNKAFEGREPMISHVEDTTIPGSSIKSSTIHLTETGKKALTISTPCNNNGDGTYCCGKGSFGCDEIHK